MNEFEEISKEIDSLMARRQELVRLLDESKQVMSDGSLRFPARLSGGKKSRSAFRELVRISERLECMDSVC